MVLNALLFPGRDLPEALRQADALRVAIAAIDCSDFAPGLRLTASIGVTDRVGLGHHERMVSRADQRLYEAKHGGRDRVVG